MEPIDLDLEVLVTCYLLRTTLATYDSRLEERRLGLAPQPRPGRQVVENREQVDGLTVRFVFGLFPVPVPTIAAVKR